MSAGLQWFRHTAATGDRTQETLAIDTGDRIHWLWTQETLAMDTGKKIWTQETQGHGHLTHWLKSQETGYTELWTQDTLAMDTRERIH